MATISLSKSYLITSSTLPRILVSYSVHNTQTWLYFKGWRNQIEKLCMRLLLLLMGSGSRTIKISGALIQAYLMPLLWVAFRRLRGLWGSVVIGCAAILVSWIPFLPTYISDDGYRTRFHLHEDGLSNFYGFHTTQRRNFSLSSRVC
jgi:hypothetical protein